MKLLTTTNIKTTLVALVLFAGVPVAFAWTAAPANPPKDNVEAPINVSKNDQNKTGKLGLGGLAVFGRFQLIDGTQGVGKVLVSDADGKASWGNVGSGAVVSGGGSGGGQLIPGWPNDIVCASGNVKTVLHITNVGYPKAGVVSYVVPTYSGTQPLISYSQTTKDFDSIIAQTTMGPDVAKSLDSCKKNISNI